MRRLRPCLPVLPEIQRRVLVLRAGLGPRREPLTRAQTARKVDKREQTVRRIERRALHTLRVANRHGTCGTASSGTATTADGADAPDGSGSGTVIGGDSGGASSDLAAAGTAGTSAGGGSGAGGSGAGGSGAGGGGTSGGSSSKGATGAVKGAHATHRKPTGVGGVVATLTRPAKPIPFWIWIVLALAAATWFAVHRVRRHRRIQRMRYY